MKDSKLDPEVFIKAAIKVFKHGWCMCIALDSVLGSECDTKYHRYVNEQFKPQGATQSY